MWEEEWRHWWSGVACGRTGATLPAYEARPGFFVRTATLVLLVTATILTMMMVTLVTAIAAAALLATAVVVSASLASLAAAARRSQSDSSSAAIIRVCSGFAVSASCLPPSPSSLPRKLLHLLPPMILQRRCFSCAAAGERRAWGRKGEEGRETVLFV